MLVSSPANPFWLAKAAHTAAHVSGSKPVYSVASHGSHLAAYISSGLGHLWAVVTNTAPYKNIILAAPLEHYEVSLPAALEQPLPHPWHPNEDLWCPAHALLALPDQPVPASIVKQKCMLGRFADAIAGSLAHPMFCGACISLTSARPVHPASCCSPRATLERPAWPPALHPLPASLLASSRPATPAPSRAWWHCIWHLTALAEVGGRERTGCTAVMCPRAPHSCSSSLISFASLPALYMSLPVGLHSPLLPFSAVPCPTVSASRLPQPARYVCLCALPFVSSPILIARYLTPHFEISSNWPAEAGQVQGWRVVHSGSTAQRAGSSKCTRPFSAAWSTTGPSAHSGSLVRLLLGLPQACARSYRPIWSSRALPLLRLALWPEPLNRGVVTNSSSR